MSAERVLLLSSDRRRKADACAPRRDYEMLAAALSDAVILFPAPAGTSPALDVVEARSASDLRQAIEAFRRRRSVGAFVSFSEKVGMPLAMLLAVRRDRTPHVLVAHHLTSPRKRALQSRTRWLNGLARILVVARPQADYLRDEVRLSPDRFSFIPDAIDAAFWRPSGVDSRSAPAEAFVLSVGRERRDYTTLLAAARQLPDTRFVIVADSLWARQRSVGLSLSRSVGRGGEGGEGNPIPPNVTVRSGLPFPELRALYDAAALIVVPLDAGTRYAAGANGLLEGMAMRRPVVLTETPGLSGYAPGGQVERVPAGDPAALAAAVRVLLGDATAAARCAAGGRAEIEAEHTLESYVEMLRRTVCAVTRAAAGAAR